MDGKMDNRWTNLLPILSISRPFLSINRPSFVHSQSYRNLRPEGRHRGSALALFAFNFRCHMLSAKNEFGGCDRDGDKSGEGSAGVGC